MSRKRQFFFDTLLFTFSAFGGPQAHLAYMLRHFVNKRHYITETELLELNALAQVLPGPSSSQTLAGLAYKIGGRVFAILIYLVWCLPSAMLMCFAALYFKTLEINLAGMKIMLYIESIAVGFVAYAAWGLLKRTEKGPLFIGLIFLSCVISFLVNSPYVFPIMIFTGGITASIFRAGKEEKRISSGLITGINPLKLIYFTGIFLVFALLGAIINRTSPFSLPVRLFQNFYRNGIFIYGGGHVLVPFMYTEFVSLKKYLSSSEFLSGFALQQALPGPTFSFTSFIGAMSMGNAGYSTGGQIIGSLLAMVGINAPGLILMLFIVPFWEKLKEITHVKNSLEGITAVSIGFILAALISLSTQVYTKAGTEHLILLNLAVMLSTFSLLSFTRIPAPLVLLIGLAFGLLAP